MVSNREIMETASKTGTIPPVMGATADAGV